MLKLTLIRQDVLYPEAISNDNWGLVGSFLKIELRDKSSWDGYWGPHITRGAYDHEYIWEGSGNVHSIDVEDGLVVISNPYLSDSAIFTLKGEVLLKAVDAWFAFIDNKKREELVEIM